MRLSKIPIILIFLFAIGIFLRLIPVITGNTFFWFDQGLDVILVKLLVVDHRINLVSRYSGLQGVLMGPVYTWLMSIPFVLSNGDARSFGIFMSLISLISAGATYVFVKKYVNKLAAIFATGWVLIAPRFVFSATVAASPFPLTFLFIFFLWFTYEIFLNKKSKFWMPLLFLTGMFFQFEIGFALFTIPTILALMIIFKIRPSRYFFLGILLLGLTFVPQLLFDIRHNFLITKGFLGLFSKSGGSLYTAHSSLVGRFGERTWSFGDDFLTMVLLFREPWIVIPAVLTAIYGWYLSKQKKLFVFLATIITVYYIGFSFYPGPIWDWYRAGLPIVYVLLFVIPFAVIWENYKISRLVILIFFLAIAYKAIDPTSIVSQLKGKEVNDVSSLKNQKQVLDYVYRSANGQQFSYFAYTPPVYDYTWQYDFWQYGKSKYGYLPKNWQMSIPLLGIGVQASEPKKDEGLFFLIMEPNPERPWERDGWEKKMTGKILETKNFPGDVVVEKRTTLN